MATTPFSKLAYQTLQQGKGLAGLVHKDLSTRLMSFVAPEAVPSTESVPPEMLNTLRAAMAKPGLSAPAGALLLMAESVGMGVLALPATAQALGAGAVPAQLLINAKLRAL